ncbi:kelch-like protein 23 isoform X1 [Physeter macrocephalus]|uniref:Kelch-like protein 23 isoform X1 n=10 Tax=Odontoceti TaxID=9722 RepID=A0A2Y9EW60_PHYMC|nr:kelch-like protein 23 isoform X1 [Physeter catodon]|eukprot:XP_007109907.2 kelch-like protein 23 isoform X1 [Physeter catodon]
MVLNQDLERLSREKTLGSVCAWGGDGGQVPGEGQKLAARAVSSGKPSHLLPGSPPGRGRSHAPARPPRPCPQRGPASREFPRAAPRPRRVGGRSVGGREQPGHQNRSRLWAGAALAGSLRRASSKDGQRVRRRPRPRSPLARWPAARPGAAAGAMALKGQEDYIYLFKDSTHPVDFLDAFKTFYLDGLFTDITLQCPSGIIFHCHRAVLAACSNYFKAMFTADMKEKFKNKIKISGIQHDILEGLVNYAYTSQIEITKRNVQSLLEAADLLQFLSVKKACEQFLVRHLDIDNCIGMHSFAEFHVCPELEKESRRILCSRFKEVWQQEEFLEISLEKFLFILSRKNLSVWKEEAVIEPVIKWTAHDVENRIECLYNLLSYINIDIDPVYLKTALGLQRSCLLTENKIRSLIYNALNPMHKEISQRSTATMYIIGGYYWHPLSEVHVWDPLTNVWIQGAEIPDYTRESYGVTCLGPNIYVTGGYRTDNIEALDTVWIYNSESDEWTEGLPMLNARYYHCAVTLGGCVYALGGYRKGAPAEEAEFYDPLKEKWIPIANMIKGVGNATACVLHEVIYVIGGHCGYRGSCTYDKVQSYNSDINEWSLITSSPHPEYGLCSVPFENKLYLVGGQTTITECYDPEQNEWREIAPMMERRMECGAVIMNGCIYVTGGYSYSKGTYLQSIEKYDPDLNKWEIVGNLPSAMRSHGCVCVYNV